MILESVAVWLVTNVGGFLTKQILTSDFVQDLFKDYAKDFFKDRFNSVPQLFQKEPIQKAVAKAVKEFLQLVEQELKFRRVNDEGMKQYIKPLKTFIKHKQVKEILGKAFDVDCDELDYQTLARVWQNLNLPELPAKFSWQLVSDKYLRKCQEILAESAELRDILILQKLDVIHKEQQDRGEIKPEFDLRRYQEAIRESYANIKLDSLDTSGSAYNELRLWRIFIPQNVREVHQVLPQVHELPKEHLRRLRESGEVEAAEIALEELERHKRVYFEQPLDSVKKIVENKQKYQYLVILGDPGSGKSTLLQYLALDWVEKTLDQLEQPDFQLPPVPLLIELRTYMRNQKEGHCKNFLEFFHQSGGAICHLNQHQLQAQLKAGNALVMFDGLDEVFDPGKREDVITAIHRFTNEYPEVQVIVTSRVIGYKAQRLRDAQFSHFMLQDLELEQIQDFIQRWHDLTFSDEADKVRKRERLQRAIKESKSIAELAGNPLLLTMMAILNRHQELPRDRPELYLQASRVLLHQWDVERALIEDARLDPKTIDYKDKQAMLRQVAYQMQTSEKGLAGNLINAGDLERILIDYLRSIDFDKSREVARVMINQLRSRNFMLCFLGADCYAFVHRTFLEYFCAWEFVWQLKETQTMSIEDLKTEVFGKHWRDETWHEVLRLISGMINAQFVGQIITYLMEIDGETEKFVNLFLAAECLAEVRNRQEIKSTAEELLERLKDLIKYDLPYYYSSGEEFKLVREIRTEAITAVTSNYKDDPRTFPFLQQCVQDYDEWVRTATVDALASNYKDDLRTFPFLQQCVQDYDGDVRYAAVSALASNYKDDPRTFPILQQCVQDDNSDVLRATVNALASNYKDDPRTFSILQQCVQDDDEWVRYAAVSALASNYKDDPRTFPILQQCVQDDNSDVLRATVNALASNYKDDPRAFPILQECIQDYDEWVRIATVLALASNYKDDPRIFPILQQCVQDDDGDVRSAAVSALASNYKDDPRTFPFLQKYVQDDNDEWVRSAAVKALASNYKDDTRTFPFLQECVQDYDGDVRYAAVSALASNYKDDPHTFSILQECVNDNYEDVRRATVSALASDYKDDPRAFPILQQCIQDDDEWVRRATVRALASNYKDDTRTFPFLQKCVQDDDEDVRYAAVLALASNYKDDPCTFSILQKCVQDDDEDVRYAAVLALGKYFQYQPELFDIYYNCAVNDPFQRREERETNPRRVALEIIIKQFPQDHRTLPLLRDRAKNDPDEEVREYAEKKLRKWENNRDGELG